MKCTVLVIQITYNMNIKFYQHRRLLDKDIRDMVGVVVTSKVIRLLMKSARGNKGTNKVRIITCIWKKIGVLIPNCNSYSHLPHVPCTYVHAILMRNNTYLSF